MPTLDWSRCPAVESVPGKVGGAWVFRGTRLPVATVIENLEDLSVEEVMAQFDVSREQIAAVLDFVLESLRDPAPADAQYRPVLEAMERRDVVPAILWRDGHCVCPGEIQIFYVNVKRIGAGEPGVRLIGNSRRFLA